MTATLVTPRAGRTDLATATDSELFIEYALFADAQLEYFAEGKNRSDNYGRREDSYAKAIKARIWDRGYDAALNAAKAHPAVHTNDDAEAAADAALGELLELGGAWANASKCATGMSIANMAMKAATSKAALQEVHRGTVMSNAGGNRHTVVSDTADRDEEKDSRSRANRRIYALDPQEYGLEAARTISGDGLSYDLTAVEDALDQRFHGSLTETEAAIEWFIETATSKANVKPEEALTWLHTTGLTDEVQEYIDLVAATGSRAEAARLADQRRFPLEDIATLTGDSLATVKRRIKKARDAVYSDCTLTGTLRSGSLGTRRAEADHETLEFALTTSLKTHAQQAGQNLTKALVAAVPDAFFADYIAEYMADGTVAADIDPSLIAEMRAAAEAVAA
jgi:predicted DNA-binding protein (UPF0251 family)